MRDRNGVRMDREGTTKAQREPRVLAGTTPCPESFVRYPFLPLGGPRPTGCQSAIGIWIGETGTDTRSGGGHSVRWVQGKSACPSKHSGHVRRTLTKQLYDPCPSVDLNKDDHVTTALNRSTIFGPAAAVQKINGRVRRGLAKQLYDSCPSVDLNKDEHVTTALNSPRSPDPLFSSGTIGHPQTGIGALGVVTCGLPRPLTSTTTCGLLFESTTSLQL